MAVAISLPPFLNSTLFSDIQRLFERTYAAVGINLEECLIDRHRCGQLSRLAGASARELSEVARTFLRTADGRLHVGIYYSKWLIEQLERNDPRASLNNANIRSLIAFIEEINHALHAALQCQEGRCALHSEAFVRDLELQAQGGILTWCCCFSWPFFAKRKRRRWPTAAGCVFISLRAMTRTRIATPTCGGVTWRRPSWPLPTRGIWTRSTVCAGWRKSGLFHALDYEAKKQRILALPAPAPEAGEAAA